MRHDVVGRAPFQPPLADKYNKCQNIQTFVRCRTNTQVISIIALGPNNPDLLLSFPMAFSQSESRHIEKAGQVSHIYKLLIVSRFEVKKQKHPTSLSSTL